MFYLERVVAGLVFVCFFKHVMVQAYATPPNPISTPDPRYSCSVDGNIVPNGHNFTTKLNGPCFIYRCERGAFHPVEYNCPYGNNKCLAIGTNVTTSQCIIQQCQQHGQSVSYSIIKDGCSKFGSGCIDVNTSYKDGCTSYTCLKEQSTYHLAITGWGCHVGDKCLKPNETITTQCNLRRCEKRNSIVGMFDVRSGCQFFNGSCINEGEVAIHQCRLYSCQLEKISGVTYYSTKAKAAMCEDYKGACHQNGSPVEIKVNGATVTKCTCVINGMNVGYKC